MTNAEFNDSFRLRTRNFAVGVLTFLGTLPTNTATRVIAYQLAKSASSVGANFRAFCRGRSKAEKFSKICIVVEEADECEYWLEIIREMDYGVKTEVNHFLTEALEILKICQKIKTAFSP